MRGWVVSAIVGTGTDLDPYRPQVMDRPAVDGDRLDIVIGAADRCLVAAEVSVDNFAQHGGLVLCLEDDFDAPFSSLPPPVRNALNRIGGTGATIRERVRSAGLLLDPNFHEGKLLGNTAAPPTGSFVDDTFTDTDGVFLPAHTPSPTGTSWTKPSYAATDLRFVSNRLRPNGNGTLGICYATPAAAGPEQVVEAVVRIVSNPAGVQVSTGISGRRSTTTDDGYDLYVNKDTADVATILMRKRVAAASTILASYATTHTVSSDVTIKLSMWDSVKRFYVNGTERGSSTDNVHTGAGRVGVFNYQGSGVGDAAGYHIDSFVATDLAAPTYPTVAGTTEGGLTSAAATNLPVTLPAGGASTDEYLVIIAKGSAACTINALTDWTELTDENTVGGLAIIRYTGAGVPSDPTFVQSTASRSVWGAYRISGADKTITPQIGTVVLGTNTTIPDPPAVTVTGGPKDVLSVACFSVTSATELADDDTLVTTFPTNYTLGQIEKTGGTGGVNLGGMLGAAASQVAAASSENPGTFTQNSPRSWRAQTIVFHPAPSALNLSATGGAATASGGTVAAAATWTADTGVATAAGGVATASSAAAPVNLSAAAGTATAGGGTVALARVSVSAAGAASASGGTVALTSTRVATGGLAAAAGGTATLTAVWAATAGTAAAGGGTATVSKAYFFAAAGGVATAGGGAVAASKTVFLTAAAGVGTAAGGAVSLAATRVAAAGVATAGGGTVTLAASLVAAGGTSAATGGAATATTGTGVSVTATNGAATAAGGTVLLSAALLVTSGTATASGGTVGYAKAVFFSAAGGTAITSGSAGFAPAWTASSGTATAGGTVSLAATRVAATGLATAAGGTVALARTSVAAAGVATAVGGTVNANIGAAVTVTATNGLATAGGGTLTQARQHVAAAGVASASGGAVTAGQGTSVTAANGSASATGGTVNLAVGQLALSATGGTAIATGTAPALSRTHLAASGVATAGGGAVDIAAAGTVNVSAVSGVSSATGGLVAGTWRYVAAGGAAGASGGTVVRTSLAAGGVANATGGAVAARLVYTSTAGLALAAGGTVDAAGAAFIPFGLIEGFGSSAATVDGSAASSVTGSSWGVDGTVDGTGSAGTDVDGTGGVPVLVE